MPSIRSAIQAYKTGVRIDNPNSRRLYHRAIDAFAEFVAATASLESPVQALRKSVVVEFVAWMAAPEIGYAATTRQIYRNVLRGALRYWRATQEGWITFSAEEDLEAEKAAVVGGAPKPEFRHTRVPDDFGNRMALAALALPLPEARLERLGVLRLRALVFLLRATALRVGDLCRLTIADLESARVQGGRLEVKMEKTGETAHCRLGPETLRVVAAYVTERDDHSPWLLIQHGKSDRRRQRPTSFFRNVRRGYGARLSPVSAWSCVQRLAAQAGFDRLESFTGPHAFRHWHADALIEQGVSLENVQAVLGHVNPAVTKRIYTSGPNRRSIDEAEAELQALPPEIADLL
jgi:site-specific recombinase XerD